MKISLPRIAIAAFGIGTALAAGPSMATSFVTITVNSNADVSADDGACTLREAIKAAATQAASGSAPGECPAGGTATMIDVRKVTGTITLTGGQIEIEKSMSIRGPGDKDLVVNSGGAPRVFHFAPDAMAMISGIGMKVDTAPAAAAPAATPDAAPAPATSAAMAVAPAAIVVNSTADVMGDDGVCTLREAVAAADSGTPSGAKAGECAAGARVIDLSALSGSIVLNGGPIAIAHAVVLRGPGDDKLTISGTSAAFLYAPGAETTTITGVAIKSAARP